ncbi:MAG TPA: murein biosynthesis integral membrane protein MurJ [Longimicrobiales bacterium]
MSRATEVAAPSTSARSARWVAAGILLSRLAGLVRERAIAHYLGVSAFADVVRTAFRMPNVLQNLLGEGTLSASFIPVYAELLEEGREEEAGRVAGAIFGLLVAAAGALALIGILFAPVLVSVFAPGFTGLRRELTIASVRIIFPMAGVLVLSAWALGILNSHRRFFVSYVAPVAWNIAIIASLVAFGGAVTSSRLVIAVAWGALVGGVLQFAVQLPWVFSLERRLRVSVTTRLAGVREAVRNAGPAIAGRGVVQLSGYVDIFLASFISLGSIALLGYAQTLYLLPISLFGMSVAAAELPELSRERSRAVEALRERIDGGLTRIAFYVVPSTVAYLALGDVIVAALYQSGDFGADESVVTAVVLAGYALGLLASTATRLFSSAFFALHDTRTPAKIAAVRVVVSAAAGAALMFGLETVQLRGHTLGALGLSLGATLAAWLEWGLLRRSLRSRIGPVGAGGGALGRMIAAAAIAALAGRGVFHVLPPVHPVATAAVVLTVYGFLYLLVGGALGLEQARRLVRGAGRATR